MVIKYFPASWWLSDPDIYDRSLVAEKNGQALILNNEIAYSYTAEVRINNHDKLNLMNN